MLAVFFAFLTIFGWGTWLAPSQNVPVKNEHIRIFYLASANLIIAFFVGLSQGFDNLNLQTFWLPCIGGAIWAISGYFGFIATKKIGIAKAVGIWGPMNLIVSIAWGIILFREFVDAGMQIILLAAGSVAVIIIGILIIVLSGSEKEKEQGDKKRLAGYIGAIIAGFLWGSYFIPIRISETSMWVAAFPMSVGIFLTSLILVLITRKSIILEKPKHYLFVSLTGILWAVGNYASLRLMELVGTGKGFTLAQLNVAVNALIGIFIFKRPEPKSKAAVFTFIGIAIAMTGAIFLGNLKG
ncbi:MAG: hypothetical protein JW969_05370 [Spirochaetales bacterium]|nr:hypothetical protein [Spirochaetales bacterium]